MEGKLLMGADRSVSPGTLGWYQHPFFLSLVTTIFCFALTYLFFGFYYVDYEGLFDALYSGALTPGVRFGSIYFLAHIGLSQGYSWLYTWWPQVEWHSWILYAYLFTAASLCLYLVALLLPQRYHIGVRICILIAIYWLVFADHSIHFIFTRVSYLLTGASMMALIVLFPGRGEIRPRLGLFVFLLLLLTLGILTRLESGTAALSLLAVWGWYMLQDIRLWLRIFVYPLLLVGVLIAGISHEIRTGTAFYLQIEPDIEVQYGERQNMLPLSDMHTHRDSIMYQAASNMMWSDPTVLTPAYLRSLIQKEALIYTDLRQWARTYSDITTVLGHYKILLMVWLLLFMAVCIQVRPVSRWATWYLVLFELSFWGLNVMQTYTAKINDRSFAPFLSLFILCHVLMLALYTRQQVRKRTAAIIVSCGILWCIHLIYLKAEANTLRSDWRAYEANLMKIGATGKNKIIAVNSNSLDYLCLANRPFHRFDFSIFRRVYITDGSMIPFLPYYKKYLERDCRCSVYHFPDIWYYLAGMTDEVIVLSEPARMHIVSDYLKEIHHYILPIREVKTVTLAPERKCENRDNPEQIYIYSLGTRAE